MHPGSLYYHFRNKEQLYLEVLDYYLQWHLQPRIQKHLIYGSCLTGLRRFFTSGYRHNQELAFQNCCFLVSTSTELHLLPTEASSMVKTGIQQLRDGFLEHLKKTTQQEKALDIEDLDIEDLEKTVSELTNLYLSLQLMARVDPNQRRLDKQVNDCLKNLTSLDGKKNGKQER